MTDEDYRSVKGGRPLYFRNNRMMLNDWTKFLNLGKKSNKQLSQGNTLDKLNPKTTKKT